MVKPIGDKSPTNKSTKCDAVAQKFPTESPVLYITTTRYGTFYYNTNDKPNFK